MKYIHAINLIKQADIELNRIRMLIYERGDITPLTEKEHQEFKDLCLVQGQLGANIRVLDMMSDINSKGNKT